MQASDAVHRRDTVTILKTLESRSNPTLRYDVEKGLSQRDRLTSSLELALCELLYVPHERSDLLYFEFFFEEFLNEKQKLVSSETLNLMMSSNINTGQTHMCLRFVPPLPLMLIT